MKPLNLPIQKKILVVAESIDVEDSSGTKGRVALIKNLNKVGFEVLVYHYTRKEIQLPGITCVSIKENRLSGLFLLSRAERYLRNYLNLKINKPLEKIFGFSFTLFNDRNSIVDALKKNENFTPDLVLTLSKGGSFRPHHALLKLPELHKKWMAYIHDPYPMHLYPRPYTWVEPGYDKKYRFVKNMTQKAKYLAFPSEMLMDWMSSYFPDCKSKGIVIPHQIADLETDLLNFPDYFNCENFNILHAGNLLWGRDPKGLIEGFKLFLKNNEDSGKYANLILLGGKNHYSNYLSQVTKECSQIYISEDYIAHLEVIKMQDNSDVNVILEAKSEISPFLPGKFPHCISADKPILLLGPYYSESRRLLGVDYLYWAETDDINKIAKLLENLFEQWKISSKKIKLNRPDLREYHSETYLAKTVNQIFEKE